MISQNMRWILWNLFLSSVPVALGLAGAKLAPMSRKKPWLQAPLAVVMLLWLAFLPNSCYLMTEWRHFLFNVDASNVFLRPHGGDAMLRLLVYTAFYFCYSGFGMMTFTLAIRPLDRIRRRWIPNSMIAHGPLFLLMSVAVYLGLVLRHNSWDIVTRPGVVWTHVVDVGAHPLLMVFILFFAVYLWLSYVAIDMWIDAFMIRWYLRQGRKAISS